MSKITLDATLRAKLNGLNESLEVCNEDGETVGHFLPASAYRKLLYQIAESQYPRTPGVRKREDGVWRFWKGLDRA